VLTLVLDTVKLELACSVYTPPTSMYNKPDPLMSLGAQKVKPAPVVHVCGLSSSMEPVVLGCKSMLPEDTTSTPAFTIKDRGVPKPKKSPSRTILLVLVKSACTVRRPPARAFRSVKVAGSRKSMVPVSVDAASTASKIMCVNWSLSGAGTRRTSIGPREVVKVTFGVCMRPSSSEDTTRSPALGVVLPSTSLPPVHAVMYTAVPEYRLPSSSRSPRVTVTTPLTDKAALAEISIWPEARDARVVGPNVGARETGPCVVGVVDGARVGTTLGAQLLPGTVGVRVVGITVGANVTGIPVGDADTGMYVVGFTVGAVVVGVGVGAPVVGVRLVGLDEVGEVDGVRVVGAAEAGGKVGPTVTGLCVGALVPEL
jgi:hypothetical protein